MSYTEKSCSEFLELTFSKEPAPGGGGVSVREGSVREVSPEVAAEVAAGPAAEVAADASAEEPAASAEETGPSGAAQPVSSTAVSSGAIHRFPCTAIASLYPKITSKDTAPSAPYRM